MEGTWYTPNQDPDENESKAEKKDKKDPREVMKKASLLELFEAHQEEQKEKTQETEKNEEIATDEVEDMEASPEELSSDEQLVISEQLVDERLEDVEQELSSAEITPESEAAAVAAALYLEQIAKHLDNGEELNEEVFADAVESTSELITQADLENELPDSSEEPPEDPVTPTPPTPPVLPPQPPRMPPTPPQGPGSNLPQYPQFPGGNPMPYGANPSQPNFNSASMVPNTESTPSPERHSHAKYVLAGGIVGYLLGRRRGRIKTEDRLMPIQEKLENQVDDLRQQLFKNEQTVRKLAAEDAVNKHALSRHEALNRVQNERQKRADQLEALVEKEPKRPEQLGKFALLLEKQPEQSRALHDNHLIEIARKIPFEGSSVAELYRAGRIDMKELREIAEAFMAGKSYEQLTIKALQTDAYQGTASTPPTSQHNDAMSRLADLLPHHMTQRMNNDHWPEHKKEAHIMTRVGVVAAFTTLVVVIAVIVTLWMFRAL